MLQRSFEIQCYDIYLASISLKSTQEHLFLLVFNGAEASRVLSVCAVCFVLLI